MVDNNQPAPAPPPLTPAQQAAKACDDARNKAEAEKREKEFLASKADKIWSEHPTWDRDTCGIIAQGKARIGMSAEQVRAAWGAPERVNRTVYSFGVHEQWVYGDNYAYFENGVLTSHQTSR